jgi:TolB-like protein/Tfp pilus assembly protein PilF/DNA-binding winged helix-turn-helix (wHTH) protein
MSKLELILLGRFECLLSSGTRVGLAMRKAEVLLAFLALTPGLRHPRERLINLLWSNRGEEQARNSLRQCLSAIRKSLGEAADLALQIDRTTVCLNAEIIEVDVHEFERLAAAGDYESLVTAADLYQGEFLEGIAIRDAACQEWLESERARFKRQFVEILAELAETQLVSHDFGNAIRSAERLVEQDPLAETGWRLLMQSYADSGDRSHALQAFKRCQQVLHRELEVDPEQATVELRDRIAAGEPRSAPGPAAAKPAPRAPGSEHSVVVLPFDNLSGDPQQEYFSDGITENLILNLGSFSDIRVKSRHASFAFKGSTKSIADLSAELGVGYVVEGSVRKSADILRITVQLTDAADGNQVWGRRFDSAPENLFDLEQELCLTIAGTVSGRIEKRTRISALQKPTADLRAYDYYMRGHFHIEHFTSQDLHTAIELLEKCLALDPDYAPAHGLLGMAHLLQRYENMSEDRDRSLESARRHLERSLQIDPHDAATRAFMAEYLLCAKDFDLAAVHARKSVELNPALADGYSMLAWHASATGQHEQALEYARQSMQVDQFHPYAGWNAGEIYRMTGDYQRAIDTFRSMAHLSPSVHAQIAACFAGLDRLDEARLEMRKYLDSAGGQMNSVPTSRDEWYRLWEDTVPYRQRQDSDRLFELLLRAGLCDEAGGDEREQPSIAVLPFDNMSGDPEQEHFADGITTDIVAILSKFRQLRTVSRYSTLQYKRDKPGIADVAAQQGVRYVLEGSVRKSGERIRVNAELIDSEDGKILWNERYDRDLHDLFAVQDEITRNIALAMKVQFDDGEMAHHRARGASDIRAWELTLIAVDLQDTYVYRNIMESRKLAQEAIRLDPDYAFAWVVLAWTHFQETFAGWCKSFEASIAAAADANRKALEIDPDYGEAWSQAGTIATMKQESEAALEACRKAVEIEPGNAEIQALMAMALQFSGAYDEARKHYREVTRLCPVQPNWYYLFPGHIEMQTGNPRKAIEIYRQGVEVEAESPLCRFFLVDALFMQGDEAAARVYADEIRALDESVKGRGLVRSYSNDEKLRQRLRASLEKFDLY